VYVISVFEQVLAPGDDVNVGVGRVFTVMVFEEVAVAAEHPFELL